MQHAITTLAIFLDGTLAGTFLGSCLVEHAARVLPPSAWLGYKQAKEAVFGPVMPVFFGVSFLVSIAGAVLAAEHRPLAACAVLLAAALVITIRVHLPLNAVIQSWTADSMPPDWDGARRRWRSWNWLRGLFAVLAFAAALASVV